MTTITIAQDITATLTNRKAEQYRKAMDASLATHYALKNENLDWGDIDYFYHEEWEAWERFFS